MVLKASKPKKPPSFSIETKESRCTCVDCNPLIASGYKMIVLKEFAEELWRTFNSSEHNDKLKEFLKLKTVEDLSTLREYFSPFMAKQLQYFVAKNILPKAKVVSGYDENGQREAPHYVTFHDKDNNRVVSVDDTYIFVERPFPHVVYANVGRSNSILFRITFHTKHQQQAEQYMDYIKDNVNSAELFKGSLLQVEGSGEVDFIYNVQQPDLYLKRSVREEIELNFDYVINNKESIQKRRIPWRRGILLYGYPGTGKTQLCKYMALNGVKKGITTIWVTPKAMKRSEDIEAVFTFARNCSPSLLLFEDIDLFAGARDEFEGVRNLLGEFLSQLDGIVSNEGIFSVATTNRLYVLDKAISDRPVRFDAKIELDYNDFESKKSLVELFNKLKLPIDSSAVANSLQNVTPAHIQELLTKANLISLQQDKQLNTDDVISLWNKMRPSIVGAEVS